MRTRMYASSEAPNPPSFGMTLNTPHSGNVMSSISGTSGTQGIFQYLQSLSGSQATSKTSGTTSTTSTQSSPAHAISGGHHHHGGGKGGDGGALFSQIQTAVTSALQSAQSSGSTTNPNTVIQDAIASIFKNQQNITGASSSSTGTTSTTAAAAKDPDGDGDTDAPGVTDSDSSTAQSAFSQLLKANGVNPQQFKQDFLSAIQSVQNGGTASASSIFSGFPTGSAVDTLA